MMFELSQSFTFEAAHTLSRSVPLAEFEPSRRIHGHSYTAVVVVGGTKGANGMLEFCRRPKKGAENVDLFYLRLAIAEVKDLLDHRFLDEIGELGAPTMENLCEFIHVRLKDKYPVVRVTVSRITGDACTLIVGSAE